MTPLALLTTCVVAACGEGPVHPASRLLDPVHVRSSAAPAVGTIAFRSTRDHPFGDIYLMDADGSNVRRLTFHTAIDIEPDLFPGGQKVAFASARDGDLDIYVVNADGGGLTQLTDAPFADNWPAWSRSGQRIAFTSQRDDPNGEIYVMNSDGTGVTRLTNNPDVDQRPTWSPNGQEIAFYSVRNGRQGIYAMNADGGDVRFLVEGLEPDWSPDGRRIVFRPRFPFGAIATINIDGTGLSTLTVMSPLEDTIGPVWAFHGQRIAFQCGGFGAPAQICTIAADGSDLVDVTSHPAFDGQPSWNP